MDMHYGHSHAARIWACSMDMDMNMQHGYSHVAWNEYATWTWTWIGIIDMVMQHGHEHADSKIALVDFQRGCSFDAVDL
jgi:biotin carboxylase